MGGKCEICSGWELQNSLDFENFTYRIQDYLLQSDLDIKCVSLPCNASPQVVLCLSSHESIRISPNIMLPEEECYNKIKLYTSDSFVENSTSNCVIISGQFEIFKTP